MGEDYDDFLTQGYGKRMADNPEDAAKLMDSVEDVLDLDYDEFNSDRGKRTINKALNAAEDAPEASVLDEVQRLKRIGEISARYEIETDLYDGDDSLFIYD